MKKATTHTEPANHIAVFQESSIRRVWHNEEWWFSVGDVCASGLLDEAVPAQPGKPNARARVKILKGNTELEPLRTRITRCRPASFQKISAIGL